MQGPQEDAIRAIERLDSGAKLARLGNLGAWPSCQSRKRRLANLCNHHRLVR